MNARSNPLTGLVAVSLALLGIRLWASERVGYGDAEALYVTYGLHPQPSYLDHPGLVGLVARSIGGGVAPSPRLLHGVTAAVATAVPWLIVGAARLAGAHGRGAWMAGLWAALMPQMAVGLFALTPDLLLAVTWTTALGLAAYGFRHGSAAAAGNGPSPPRSTPLAMTAWLGCGLAVGVACSAKVTGFLLAAALLVVLVRARVRSPWAYVGLACGAIVPLPYLLFEWEHGFPMLRHRFVATQAGAGLSLTHGLRFVLGQALYVSPVLLAGCIGLATRLHREESGSPVRRWLYAAWALPAALLSAFMLWSPVAEGHWLAPALLALLVFRSLCTTGEWNDRARAVERVGLWSAAVLSFGLHLWVLLPGWAPLPGAHGTSDLRAELYGWDELHRALEAARAEVCAEDGCAEGEPTFVGPHWVICAQVEAGRSARRMAPLPVGCGPPIGDDFDRFHPRRSWQKASVVLFVTDDRFTAAPLALLPGHVEHARREVPIVHNGAVLRVFRIVTLKRTTFAATPNGGAQRRTSHAPALAATFFPKSTSAGRNPSPRFTNTSPL